MKIKSDIINEKWNGKVVLITGASSGIGKALAFKLIKKGAKLLLASRSLEQLEKIALELGNSKQVLIKTTDVGNEAGCKDLIDYCLENFGRLDVVVSNAGQSMRANFEEASQDVLERVMKTNYWGTIFLARHSIPLLKLTEGTFVGVSSIGAYVGLPGRSAYSSSKAAMQVFLDVLRMELNESGVKVINIAPGFTHSNIRINALIANGSKQGYSPRNESKMVPSDKVASKIIRAIEKNQRDLIMTTQGRAAILLRRIFPRLADSYFIGCRKREDEQELAIEKIKKD